MIILWKCVVAVKPPRAVRVDAAEILLLIEPWGAEGMGAR